METILIAPPSALVKSPVNTSVPLAKQPAMNIQKRQTRIQQTSTNKGDGITKPKQSKSRNGCITCKAKRLKCDETHPSCQQCHKRNVECGGYKKDFKWRTFEEATFTTKPASPRTKKAPISKTNSRPIPQSPARSEGSGSTITNAFSYNQPRSNPPPTPNAPQFLQEPFPLSPYTMPYDQSSEYYDISPYDMPFQPMMKNQHLNLTPSSSSTTYNDAHSVRSSVTAASSFTSGQSPRLIDLLLPGTDLSAPPPDYMDFRPQQSDRPYTPGGFLPNQEVIPSDSDGEIEEVIRQPYRNAESWVMRLPSPSPSSSSSSSEGSRFDNLSSLFQQPSMSPSCPEMLMARFDRQTCGILSVKDGPTENPWRTMIWPLAQDSPALYHAISAMTAFHTSKEKPELRVAGMEHMRCSIRSLASGLGTMRTDTALATTLALAFSESWDQHISTGIEHLRGAKILVSQALARHKQSALSQEDLERLKFLCNTWVYMDVIARLTSVDDDSNVFDAITQPPLGPLSLSSEIDPLMGCASTLFPLVGCVANLVRKVRKNPVKPINIISQGNELKTAIEEWVPPSFFTPPEDPSSEIQHSIQTAEAYRWATLLYLHQAVPEIPSEPASGLAKKALVYLATVPLTSRAIIVQIYPLLAAGCEAVGREDRAWVEDRWAMMSHRMLIGNIDRCWEVTKEVWDRRDAAESDMCKQRHRRASQKPPSGYSSPVKSKQELSIEGECIRSFTWSDFCGDQRNGPQDLTKLSPPVKVERSQPMSIDLQEGNDLEKTVRGRLHWAGVMKDWKWEVLLG